MFKSLKEKLSKFFGKKEDEKSEEYEKDKKKEKIEKEPEKKYEGVEKQKKDLEKLKEDNAIKLEHSIEQVEEKIGEPELEKEQGFFERIKRRFTTSRLTKEIFDEFFEELESLLLENNVALNVVDKIKEDMEKDIVNIEIKKSEIESEIKNSLKESIKRILVEPFDIIEKIREKKEGPFVILFFGINGSGKTTTISKLAYYLNEHKISCVFAASDTFRAASIEQLKKHGDNLGIKVISHEYGSDPAAVAFDAISYAKSHGIKVVMIDTAGRMHTKSNLMKEMEKIIRVCKPDIKLFIAESITGNDAVEQAKSFNELFEINGSILTKADIDEKGGTAISIGYITGKPILFLGTGQDYKNLEKFSKEELLANLGLK
ncbi:MAG: signal recognition particle-docking protein FtsY [Candidatus Pacearchaeota archaeon]